MTRASLLTAFALATVAATSLSAQTPAPPAPKTPPAAKEYSDGGRRDPFVSLIAPRVAPTAPAAASRPKSIPGAGLSGLAVSDVTVKGLIKSGATYIALLQGPDGRTYMAKREDRLQDGVVTRIESDGVVFTERLSDSAGMVHTRDVRKALRAVVSGTGEPR